MSSCSSVGGLEGAKLRVIGHLQHAPRLARPQGSSGWSKDICIKLAIRFRPGLKGKHLLWPLFGSATADRDRTAAPLSSSSAAIIAASGIRP